MTGSAMPRPFYWSVRRELWEHRAIWIAPLAVVVLGVAAFLASLPGLPIHIRALTGFDPAAGHLAIHMPYAGLAIMGFVTAFFVGTFYCLAALRSERRDRSILFWKSLPVSDRSAVLAKASIPLVVLPLLVFMLTVVAYAVMVLASSVVLLGNDGAMSMLWANVQPFQGGATILYLVVVITLWHAPIYGWLLLVSAWARRAAPLWAILPFVVIAGIERIVFFGSVRVDDFLEYLLIGWSERAVDFGDSTGMTPLLDSLTPAETFASPSLWIGLAFTAICIVLAVRLRGRREPL